MSWSKKSKIAVGVILVLALGSLIAYKVAYKPHKTVSDLKVAFSGTAETFFNTIKNGDTILKDAAIQLTGKVTNSDEKGITLNNTIYCLLEDGIKHSTISKGKKVTIKARYMGYDDLLEEIKLDKTIILK